MIPHRTFAFLALGLALALPFLVGCSSGPRRGLISREDLPRGWTMFETPHYQVVTDAGDAEAQKTAERLEGILAMYGRILPTGRVVPRFPVRMFNSYADYLSSGGEEATAGSFDQETGELTLTRFEGVDPEQRAPSEQELVTTCYHEAWHQYFHWYLETDQDPPVWFDEGMADYFGQSRPHPVRGNADPAAREWSFGRPNFSWLAAIRKAILEGKQIPLREFVHLSRDSYYRNPALCYPEGWALVHFLLNSDDPRLREVPAALTRALRDGSKSAAAVDEAFAGVDFPAMEKAWEAYVVRLR